MKKILLIAIAVILSLFFASCGNKDVSESSDSGSGTNQTTSQNIETTPDVTSGNDIDSSGSGSDNEEVDILSLIGKTIDNERLVIVSNEKDDHLYGEASHYLFLTFTDENKISQFGDAGSYYIFADEAAFDMGLEKIKSHRGSNRASLFIQGYTTFPNDWPNLTFAEIVERIETDSGKDNFSAYYDIVR